MTYIYLVANAQHPVFANDNDAFIPEVWAQESLMQLENNMVAAHLVYRDFEDEIANFGDTVNTRLPADFEAQFKDDDDEVTIQDATSPNVPVVLNRHVHTSFMIKDGEESKGFKNLRAVYLEPAMRSIAEAVDQIVLGQVYEFLGNAVGQLGVAPTKETVLAVREKMNILKVPMSGRQLILTSESESDLLAIELFTAANQVGDGGTALEQGALGMKYGLQSWMAQQTPSVPTGSTIASYLTSAAQAKGATVIAIDGLAAAITAGSWCVIAGDNHPQLILSSAGGGTPTSITITPGLKRAVVDNAAVTVYTPGAIDNVAGYASGYGKTMTVDGFAVAPLKGQGVSISPATPTGLEAVYSAYGSPTTTTLKLNRPLDVAAIDNQVAALTPAGNYSFGFHKNALALVTRPLAAPDPSTGARAFVASYGGISMRVVITYDGRKQGHLVTCDMLMGVKVLDERLGVPMLA